MKTGTVVVEGDHLKKIATSRNPLRAIEEIIWNGFDADANEVFVEFDEGKLIKLGAIRITDRGEGIPYELAEKLFTSLGDSWKVKQEKTKGGRFIHGKNGQGRFKAFALGKEVSWETTYAEKNKRFTYTIRGSASDLRKFTFTDPVETELPTGTVCTITEIDRDFAVRGTEAVIEEITERFAPYLYDNRRARLVYDGTDIDPASVIIRHKSLSVTVEKPDDGELAAELTIIEWATQIKRSLYLCTHKRFPLYKTAPSIRARGFRFTAYLASTHFDSFEGDNNEALLPLDGDTKLLIEAAKDHLREHFREREAELARDRVDEWISLDIYPFAGEPDDPLTRSERQIFDVLAVNLADYSKAFERSPREAKKVTFGLLKAALETGPSAVQRAFKELLQLPEEQQQDLNELLDRMPLTSLIAASREIVDRLDFITALRMLVFDPTSKQQLLERRQLHRILEQRTWIFGKEFNLSASDKGLTDVLNKHLALLGREPSKTPVLREDGSKGIVDLMLSRLIPQNRGDHREHLVVELKRPKQPINFEAYHQIISYVRAVAADEQFDDSKTSWVFWAISNEVTPEVNDLASQPHRPYGIVYEAKKPNVEVWVKTWAEVIQECEGRHKFVRERLNYSATDESALAHLQHIHEKYLPPVFRKALESAGQTGDEASLDDDNGIELHGLE
jgi:hypothetical protein